MSLCFLAALVPLACGSEEPAVDTDEPLSEASQPLSQCVTVQRGAGGAVEDATIAPLQSNQGSNQSLSTTTLGSEALLRFDLSDIPAGAFIDSATLELYVTSALVVGNNEVTVHAATAAWSEATVTFSNFNQSYDSAFAGEIHVSSPNTQESADLTALVTEWVTGARTNHGVLLRKPGLLSSANFRSSEGTTVAQRPALEVCYTTGVRQVDGGHFHTCALLSDGRVKCWGANYSGQLGLGNTEWRGDGPGEMGDTLPAVDLGTGKTAVQISAGYSHTCALLNDGKVKCWGANAFGQLGLGNYEYRGDGPDEMGDDLPAVDLGTGKTALQISAGLLHTCALLNDHKVKCWGPGAFGELGLGDSEWHGNEPGDMGDNLPAVDLGTGKTAVQISTSRRHTCAILNDGKVKCWGDNGYGQLGLGNQETYGNGPGQMGDNLPAVDLGTGKIALQISAGYSHTCALLNDDSIKCWGSNGNGELGLDDTEGVGDGPDEMGGILPAVDLGTGKTAVQISAGEGHTCAVLNDGSVKCWGHNGHGESGLGNQETYGDEPSEMGDNLPTVTLGTDMTAVQISAGAHHVCAGLNDGKVKCWGYNSYGQLGLGNTENRGDQTGEMGNDLPTVSLF
jgi:alpha-tubulin suppressor-like RCC1 family protein